MQQATAAAHAAAAAAARHGQGAATLPERQHPWRCIRTRNTGEHLLSSCGGAGAWSPLQTAWRCVALHRSRLAAASHCCARRYDALDELLLERLAAAGLSVQEVVAPGQQLPPPSPPLFDSLFPDMRCAVFRITRC
jgi:hypothetical protein